nr:VanZ family protein [Streptococcus thermophilus]
MSNLLLCLIALFSVESIQYFGHLGIFDLGDIVLNMLGLLVGTAIHQLPQFQTLIKKILT